MFSPDEQIIKWRQIMLAKQVAGAEALDELESHLRDDFEALVRAGLNPERAFESAVGQIGQANHLKREFEKIGETPDMTTWTSRLGVIERNVILPIKAAVILMLVYSLSANGWLGVVAASVENLWVETLQVILGPYIALNLLVAGVLMAARRIPFAWLHLSVFTASLVDGLLVSLLCLLTGGYDSALYWVFLGLTVRNTLSISGTASQLLLNLSVIGCYALVVLLDVSLGGLEATLRGGLELYAGDQVTEVVLLRVIVLLLVSICCARVQFILTRQRLRRVTA